MKHLILAWSNVFAQIIKATFRRSISMHYPIVATLHCFICIVDAHEEDTLTLHVAYVLNCDICLIWRRLHTMTHEWHAADIVYLQQYSILYSN